MIAREREFHLAFYKLFVDEYRDSKRRNALTIRFALVPTNLGSHFDLWNLETISLGGEPGKPIQAGPWDLLSIRSEHAEAGREDLAVEGMLLQRLRQRAHARGCILPAIVPTLAVPPWSRMQIAADVLRELQRAAT